MLKFNPTAQGNKNQPGSILRDIPVSGYVLSSGEPLQRKKDHSSNTADQLYCSAGYR